MTRAMTTIIAFAAMCSATTVHAQTILNGSAEVSVARNQSQAGDQENANGAVGQNYSLGWDSTLFDPRILRYNVQGSYRTSDFSSVTTGQQSQDGRVGDLGYKIGATVLPQSAMPFFFQTSRTRSRSAGDLAPSNPIRSGLIAASGAPPADFESLNRETSLGWTLGVERLPQVALNYRRGESLVSGGSYTATQRDRDLSASVLKNTRRLHQTFRYQSTDSENQMEQTFAQRLGLLDYDLSAALTAHTQLTLNAGRRSTFARSVFVTPVDTRSGAYAPSSMTGASGAQYGQVNYSYEPTPRLGLRIGANVDRQSGDDSSTAAALGSVSTHAEVVRGLVLTTTGTVGSRQQIVADTPTTVTTRSTDLGASYQLNTRWIGVGANATRGLGNNVTPDGRAGSTDSWSQEAHVSTSIAWFSAGGGYDRSRYRDEILDFGNYASERVRASLQGQATRGSISVNAEQLDVKRGRATTFIRNLQRTLSSTASLRLIGQNFISATAGHFDNGFDGAAGPGTDRSFFWSVGMDGAVAQTLRLTGWVRSEFATASRTQFNLDSLGAFARAEYRLRALNLALEYRRSHSRMRYPGLLGPDAFSGNQIRFSVIRQFGLRVR